MLAPLKKSYDQPKQHIKKQRHYITLYTLYYIVYIAVLKSSWYYSANKSLYSQSYGFSSSHVWIGLKKAEHRRIESFELWCWRRLLRVPWTAGRSSQSILRDQSWVFIGRTDVEAETPVLWPPDAKSWLIGKDPDVGKDWGQEEKGMTEDEMVGWHHQLTGHEFGWTPGVGDGQGGLACCGSWGHKESDTIEWLNWTVSVNYKFDLVLWRHTLKLQKYLVPHQNFYLSFSLWTHGFYFLNFIQIWFIHHKIHSISI